MKFKKILVIIAIVVITLSITAINSFSASFNLEAAFDGEKIILTSEEGEVEFSELNLLPGESKESYINITNTGLEKVQMDMTAEVIEDENIMNILQITIKDSKNNQLYNGEYKEFTKIEIELPKGAKETFTIQTTLPKEAGNEYQNKEAKIKFNFEFNGEKIEVPENPQTNQSKIIIYSVLILIVVILIIALIVLSRNNKSGENNN